MVELQSGTSVELSPKKMLHTHGRVVDDHLPTSNAKAAPSSIDQRKCCHSDTLLYDQQGALAVELDTAWCSQVIRHETRDIARGN